MTLTLVTVGPHCSDRTGTIEDGGVTHTPGAFRVSFTTDNLLICAGMEQVHRRLILLDLNHLKGSTENRLETVQDLVRCVIFGVSGSPSC